MNKPKAIQFSEHAREQMVLRGASEDEVAQTIRQESWAQAKRAKYRAKRRFAFDKPSPLNQKTYRFKEVEPIFADEPDMLVVVTVMVYYTNAEETQ
ncbi:MAG: hypothetical protein FJ009_01445 [Chloroflexi bacterium]|nr:hypothetical protein [Chloroflexota bacterium]